MRLRGNPVLRSRELIGGRIALNRAQAASLDNAGQCPAPGARGVVLKQSASDLLIKSIRKVASGEIWLDKRMTSEVVKAFA